MKRAITLVLALLFLFTATASAEYISAHANIDPYVPDLD